MKPYVLNTKLKCNSCNGKIFYFCRYDADFCPQCNAWLSTACGDPECLYCVDRPETPKDALAVFNELKSISQNNSKMRAIRHYDANEKSEKRKKERTKNIK